MYESARSLIGLRELDIKDYESREENLKLCMSRLANENSYLRCEYEDINKQNVDLKREILKLKNLFNKKRNNLC